MSRIGKHPIEIPKDVQVNLEGRDISVKGKLGELAMTVVDQVDVSMEDSRITVKPRYDNKFSRNMWATTRTRINNMVLGVSKGFTRVLEVNGVGYRAAVEGQELVLQLGYSHPIRYPIPPGVTMKCERPTLIAISGYDKQEVGQIAAKIRGLRPPEPYKGKGIKYEGETILRKEGKKK
ncbi:MAG: 50S ribosomal protein L6 [Alphaproteobacteria bacterium]|jgi:large subunit ribosomal protein L6|nr:50S ribosomal protein L6 [Alphaproteobacteria bacterium]